VFGVSVATSSIDTWPIGAGIDVVVDVIVGFGRFLGGALLFGLGKIQRPEVMEVTEEDIVGCVSRTAQRMKEVAHRCGLHGDRRRPRAGRRYADGRHQAKRRIAVQPFAFRAGAPAAPSTYSLRRWQLQTRPIGFRELTHIECRALAQTRLDRTGIAQQHI
jgi:hypothetical protein